MNMKVHFEFLNIIELFYYVFVIFYLYIIEWIVIKNTVNEEIRINLIIYF